MTLQVIGAGLGRTGTLSLKLALEQLGFGPCYHMLEVLVHPAREERIAQWQAIAAGAPADWETVFAGYAATVDWPACNYYHELMAAYPEAKVILSRRADADDWFRSTQETIFREQMASPPFTRRIIADIVGPDRHDRDAVVAAYERHNREVIDAVPADRLLIYTAGDGWEPLCAFLGVPEPVAPAPHVNTTSQFQAMRLGAP